LPQGPLAGSPKVAGEVHWGRDRTQPGRQFWTSARRTRAVAVLGRVRLASHMSNAPKAAIAVTRQKPSLVRHADV
jgi:hypothetical protein